MKLSPIKPPSFGQALLQAMVDRRLFTFLLLLAFVSAAPLRAQNYTPGAQHVFTHASEAVPADTYQYSLWVPKDYKPAHLYPVVFFLHGSTGRDHPKEAMKNMVSDRLVDNKPWTAAGYSGNHPNQFGRGYLHVAPAKPGFSWDMDKFKRLLDHVKRQVNIDADRVYVTGFSMGGRGAWEVASIADPKYRIAAILPLGAYACDVVRRGATPETCETVGTPVWVQHCPLDPVSKISEQIALLQNHLDCGGYGRVTMIPGEGHIDEPSDADRKYFDLRMEWMLSQSHGTPVNTLMQVDGGTILEFVSGERGFIGDTARHGFFEPGSVIRITASETWNGKRFVKWASASGTFADPTARTTVYTTAASDTQIMPLYGTDPVKLAVAGGTAKPTNPQPGDTVTITAERAESNVGTNRHFYWHTDQQVDIPLPQRRSFMFTMPSRDVTFTARVIPADY